MDDKEMQKIAKIFGKKADKYIVAIAIAQYIIKNDATIRATAEKFKIGKSTVTNAMTRVLEDYVRVYHVSYLGKETRCNLRSLSSDYDRIRVIVEDMISQGIQMP